MNAAPTGRLGRCAAALLLSCLLATAAAALDPGYLPTQYLFTAWQDELPQGTVRALAQDRDGYLWIGTQEGLVRFDGLRFTIFNPANEPALASPDIRALHVDRMGRLWVGTRGGGVAVREGGRLRTLPDFPAAIVYAIAEAQTWKDVSEPRSAMPR